jgi:glycosyltransferase involved in cell wall biosynthesis
MERNKKILFLSHGNTLNGAERVFVDCVKALKKLNYEINIVHPSKGELFEICKIYTDNISFIEVPWWIDRGKKIKIVQKIILLKDIIKSTFRIVFEIKRSKTDIVISNTLAFPSGAIATFILRKKHIWYIHEFGKEDHNFNFIFSEWLSCKLISILSDKVIFNSSAVKSKFEKYIKRKKCVVLYPAVDIGLFPRKVYDSLPFNENKIFKVAIFGRVANTKGQLEAIKAIEYLLIKKKYNVILKIIGGTNDEFTLFLKIYLLEKKIEKYIQILNFVSDPINLMKEFDLCLNCSVQEAFGLVTIESMKLGIPVIGSNSGGNLELIKNERNGLLYTQGNYKSLSGKIEFLYLNPIQIQKMGNYGYEWSNKKFNLEIFQKELNEIILELY